MSHYIGAMKVLVILLLVVFTAGCNASSLHNSPPKSKLDMLKDLFWKSADATCRAVGDIGRQLEQTEFGKEIRTHVDENVQVIGQHVETVLHQIPRETKSMILDGAIDVLRAFSDLKSTVEENLEPVVDNWLWPLAEQAALKLTEEAEPVVYWLGETMEPVTQYIQKQINTLTSLYQSRTSQPPSE